MAYSPVARYSAGFSPNEKEYIPQDHPDYREDPYLKELGQKYSKSTVQIMLNWGLHHKHIVIPKSSGLDHQKENINIFDFSLT